MEPPITIAWYSISKQKKVGHILISLNLQFIEKWKLQPFRNEKIFWVYVLLIVKCFYESLSKLDAYWSKYRHPNTKWDSHTNVYLFKSNFTYYMYQCCVRRCVFSLLDLKKDGLAFIFQWIVNSVKCAFNAILY